MKWKRVLLCVWRTVIDMNCPECNAKMVMEDGELVCPNWKCDYGDGKGMRQRIEEELAGMKEAE